MEGARYPARASGGSPRKPVERGGRSHAEKHDEQPGSCVGVCSGRTRRPAEAVPDGRSSNAEPGAARGPAVPRPLSAGKGESERPPQASPLVVLRRQRSQRAGSSKQRAATGLSRTVPATVAQAQRLVERAATDGTPPILRSARALRSAMRVRRTDPGAVPGARY